MSRYFLMLSAAALIAVAPVYYAISAERPDTADAKPAMEPTQAARNAACTKAMLDGEVVPPGCVQATEETPEPAQVEPAAGQAQGEAEQPSFNE